MSKVYAIYVLEHATRASAVNLLLYRPCYVGKKSHSSPDKAVAVVDDIQAAQRQY